jgi:hypothetical protein
MPCGALPSALKWAEATLNSHCNYEAPMIWLFDSLRHLTVTCTVIRAIMEALSTSETSISFYQTTWCNIPEDSRLHTRHRENQKSYKRKCLPARFSWREVDLTAPKASFSDDGNEASVELAVCRMVISWLKKDLHDGVRKNKTFYGRELLCNWPGL